MKFVIVGPKGKLMKLDADRLIRKFMANPLGVALDVVDIVSDAGEGEDNGARGAPTFDKQEVNTSKGDAHAF